jgi:hypothetical protein
MPSDVQYFYIVMLIVVIAECRYAECCYVECRYSDCLGAPMEPILDCTSASLVLKY